MKLNVAGKMRSSMLLWLFALIGQQQSLPPELQKLIEGAQSAIQSLTQLLAPLITIIVLIALPILVFNVLTKTVLGKI
jgi:hypothetical protein